MHYPLQTYPRYTTIISKQADLISSNYCCILMTDLTLSSKKCLILQCEQIRCSVLEIRFPRTGTGRGFSGTADPPGPAGVLLASLRTRAACRSDQQRPWAGDSPWRAERASVEWGPAAPTPGRGGRHRLAARGGPDSVLLPSAIAGTRRRVLRMLSPALKKALFFSCQSPFYICL